MFNITFQQLSMFMAVAKRLNITAVAEEAYISQAALSKMIKRLEASLETKLFERSRRGMKLTPEGKFLYNKIQAPFESICEAIAEMQTMDEHDQPILKIGYPMTIDVNADYEKLNNFIKSYKKSNTGVVFQEGVYHFDELKNKLRYGEIDVIFIPNFEMYNFDDENVDSKSVLHYPLYVAIGMYNPARKGDSLDLEILRRQPIYTLPGNSKPESIYGVLKEIGYDISNIDKIIVPNHDTLIRTLKNNDWGFAIMGNQKIEENRGIKLFSVSENSYSMALHMAWRTDNINAELKKFIRAISDNMDKFTKIHP